MLSIAGELGRRSQRQHPRTCSLTPQMPYHTGARAGDMWGPDMPSQLLPASSARRLRTFPMETGHIGASRVCWATSTRPWANAACTIASHAIQLAERAAGRWSRTGRAPRPRRRREHSEPVLRRHASSSRRDVVRVQPGGDLAVTTHTPTMPHPHQLRQLRERPFRRPSRRRRSSCREAPATGRVALPQS